MGYYWPDLRIGEKCRAFGNSAHLAGEIQDEGFRKGYLRGWHRARMALEKLIWYDGLTPLEAYRMLLDLSEQVRIWAIKERGGVHQDPLGSLEPPYDVRPPHPGFIYFLRADNGLYKIGKTTNLDNRIKQLGTKLPYELELVHAIGTDEMHFVERDFHRHYAEKRVGGEWFSLTDEDMARIKKTGYILTGGIAEGAE